MTVRTRARATYHGAVGLYAVLLLGWLVLGFLPVLGVVDASMSPFAVPAWLAIGQYLFSALNLALALVLWRQRPNDVVPRLLAIAMLGTAATFNLPSHTAFHVLGMPWPIAVTHFCFHIASGVAYLWAVVLFPDGNLPRRLRMGRRATMAVAAVVTAASVLVAWRGAFLAHPQFFLAYFGVAVPVFGIAAAASRLTDSRTPAPERQPARLLAAALLPSAAVAALWLTGRAAALAGWPSGADLAARTQELFPAVFAVVPVVLFAGVLRYRLWNIDVFLSKVLLYGALALMTSAVYVIAVVVAGSVGGGAGLAWTVVVLALAATLMEPLRTAVRRGANRIVFGQVLTPAEATRVLAHGLEQLAASDEIDQLAQVVCAATRARAADVWLVADGRIERIAASMTTGPTTGDVPLVTHGSLDDLNVPTWPVCYQGRLLGGLAVDFGGTRPTHSDEQTVGRIAEHAGLVVHNALMTVRLAGQVTELAEQSEELRRARRDLVAAHDAERRHVERDLHDGAQQALVAAVILAGGAGSPPEVAEILRTARSMLDDVCGDGRPQLLARAGLEAALRQAADMAGRTGLHVDLRVSQTEQPLDAEVEAGVYFTCVEALQNVVKHAQARQALVLLTGEDGAVNIEVRDDGRGLPPGADPEGGLRQLVSRLSVLGGRLVVESGPGGTAVRASVPVGDAAVRRHGVSSATDACAATIAATP